MANINEIKQQIQKLPSMSELKAEDYADEGKLAEQLVIAVGKDLKPTQLRKIFHHVKDLQKELNNDPDKKFDRSKVALIMPALAYAVGRGLIPNDFYEVMKMVFGAEKCKTREDFITAANFLEAVMAYHKYHEKMKTFQQQK